MYLDRTGCAWRYLPADFPPWQTVYGYFAAWRDDGTLTRLHDALRERVRSAAGRYTEPTAAIIDSQSVRAANIVPKATRAWPRTPIYHTLTQNESRLVRGSSLAVAVA